MEEHTLSEIMDTIKKKLNSTLKIDSIRKIEELLAERVNPATSIGVSILFIMLHMFRIFWHIILEKLIKYGIMM